VPLALWGALLANAPAMTVERCATPLDHPAVEQAVDLALQATAAIPGLQGYVEVDLVLAERGPVVVEIATRPTLGALALRRSRQINLARVIVDAVVYGRLPDTRFWPPPAPVLVDLADPAAALAAPAPFA
jgi:predicted ATP-grasp superfamily ATP-dependent carboligase